MIPPGAALFTDLYEITMAEAYLDEGLTDAAIFELFFRRLPPTRSYALLAGLEHVLDYLETFAFDDAQIDWLRSLGKFREPFLAQLRHMRFTGEVWAIPEGTIVFGHEPVLQVVAPIAEAQLIETFLINQLHVCTVIASKASRVVDAAQGRVIADFGARRAHGYEAGLELARSAYLAGAASSSNLLACQRYGIPPSGTMAHSFVQAHTDERRAFETFARLYPGTTLLVDTYDTLGGVRKVVEVARAGGEVGAIRLDSGDLDALSREARKILDAAGLQHIRIVASGDLDEYAIEELVAAGAPIDGFGVGTRMSTSVDAATLGFVYKLVEYAGVGRAKLSEHKVLHPGRKQVFRCEKDGVMTHDVIGRFDEEPPGRPLLVPVFRDGKRLHHESLETIRARALREREALPRELRSFDPPKASYRVEVSEALERDLAYLREQRH